MKNESLKLDTFLECYFVMRKKAIKISLKVLMEKYF